MVLAGVVETVDSTISSFDVLDINIFVSCLYLKFILVCLLYQCIIFAVFMQTSIIDCHSLDYILLSYLTFTDISQVQSYFKK